MLQQFLFAEDGTDLDPSTWADRMYSVGRELEGNPHARSLQLRHEKANGKAKRSEKEEKAISTIYQATDTHP